MWCDDLKCVIGAWTDRKGSSYDVYLDDAGTSCSVTTTRPNGEVRHTIGLIQFRQGGIFWGQNYQLQECKEGADKINWTSSRRGDFMWSRVRSSGTLRSRQNKIVAEGSLERETAGYRAKYGNGDEKNEALEIGGAQQYYGVAKWHGYGVANYRCIPEASLGWSSSWTGQEICDAYQYYRDAHWQAWSHYEDAPQAQFGTNIVGGMTATSNESNDVATQDEKSAPVDTKLEVHVSCETESVCSNSGDVDVSLSIGDRVYAYFYSDWFPATIREINCDDQGSVQVLWDGEFSVSVLASDCIAPMYVSEKRKKKESVCPEDSKLYRVEEPDSEPPSAPTLPEDLCSSGLDRVPPPPPPPRNPTTCSSPSSQEPRGHCAQGGGSLRWNRWNSNRSCQDSNTNIEEDLDLDVSCVKIIQKHGDKPSEAQIDSPTVKTLAEGRDEHGKRRMTQAERKAAKAAQATKIAPSQATSQTMSRSERRRVVRARHEEDLLNAMRASQEEGVSLVSERLDEEEVEITPARRHVVRPHAKAHSVKKTKSHRNRQQKKSTDDAEPEASDVVGTWCYLSGGEPASFEIALKDGQYVFIERCCEGTLIRGSEWLEGDITFAQIRLKPAENGQMLSQIRQTDKNDWAEPVFATRKANAAKPATTEETTPIDTCVLCDRAVISEEDDACGAKLKLCGRHLRELTSREQRLQKWAMAACGHLNALHALSSPHTADWRRTFFLEVKKLDLLIQLMLEHGEDLDEEDTEEATPLELALDALLFSLPDKGKAIRKGKAKKCPCCEGFGNSEGGEGAFNVAVLLAWHWKEGRGDVMPELEEFCSKLAECADALRKGEFKHEKHRSSEPEDDTSETESESSEQSG